MGDAPMSRLAEIVLFATMSMLPAGAALSQQTLPDLVGTWKLVLVDNVLPDGTRTHLYGPNPHGLLVFDTTGHYALEIMSDGRPKFAANDKSKGTAEEYSAAVQGSNCHFGKYKINERDHTVTLYVEHATFSNWEGSELTLPFMVTGDESKFIVPHPTTGGPGVIGEIMGTRLR
jgi:hypothetical protein